MLREGTEKPKRADGPASFGVPDVTDALEVAQRQVERYQNLRNLVAILLIGSTARLERTPSSDVDIACLIDPAEPWVADVRDGGRHATVDESGLHVEVLLTSCARVERRMLAAANDGSALTVSGHRLESLIDGQLLYGGGPAYQSLADRARVRWNEGPPGMTEQNRRWVGFEVWKMLHLWVEGLASPSDRLRRGVALLDYLLDLAFRLERQWAPVQKHLLRRVADLDTALERLAQEYLAAPESTDRLRAVAEYLADKHELALSGEYKSGQIWPRGPAEP